MNNYALDLNHKNLTIEKVGGKALNLSKMISAGFNIPSAFIVTADAYNNFIKKELKNKIRYILNSVNFKDKDSISQGCTRIRSLINSGEIPEKIFAEINKKIDNLPEGYYAVRSSAVAEDLPDASFAGQLDSFLNIKKENVLEKIVECWASYWNERQ